MLPDRLRARGTGYAKGSGVTEIPHPWACSQCGTLKREVNHWYLVFRDSRGFDITPWEEDWVRQADEHLCGRTCATKSLERWMGKWNGPITAMQSVRQSRRLSLKRRIGNAESLSHLASSVIAK